DEVRTGSYRAAINALVKDKIALDLGTGSDAVLARMCVEGGARGVYAIEMLEEAYINAKALVARLGLEDRIIVLRGDAKHVELPEKVDVCVSELIGMIGSSEGVVDILNDARRFLKSDGRMIPERSATLIAAVSLPEELAEQPRLTKLTGHYTDRIFEEVGYPFDVRLCIKNLPVSHIIS